MGHIIQATASGEEHGLVGTFSNSVEFNDFKHSKPKIAEDLRKQKKDDARLVKVRYHNSRGRHERLDKHYCRYAGDPIQKWHLIPGYVYEVPYGFVKEVNGMQPMQRSGLLEVDGTPVKKDESPLDKDQKAEQLHYLYPAEFQGMSA